MRATMKEGIELLDLSSRLRKINEAFTFAISGWNLPEPAGAAIGIPSGPLGEHTIAEMQMIRSRLLELAELEAPETVGWVAEPLLKVAEASRQCGEIYDGILERREEAAAAFRQAAADYQRCGIAAEAENALQRAAMLDDSASSDVETQIAAARAATNEAKAGTVDSALCWMKLGELLLQASNSFSARDAFQRAEAEMAAAGHTAPPDGMAALLTALSGPPAPNSVQMVGEVLKLRLAFHRMYDGLARSFDPINAETAATYRQKIREHQLLTPRTPADDPRFPGS